LIDLCTVFIVSEENSLHPSPMRTNLQGLHPLSGDYIFGNLIAKIIGGF
jgi:hypothetical protein